MTNSKKVAAARTAMPDDVMEAVKALEGMSAPQLRARYREVFKEDARSHNVPWMRKRIGYRLQEMAFGGLSERAKARIQELVVDAPIRRRGFLQTTPPAPAVATTEIHGRPERDPRLPPAGTALRRQYGKQVHVVIVEEDGFVFRGQKHESLSRVAKLIAGTNWNGFTFFGLTKAWEAA